MSNCIDAQADMGLCCSHVIKIVYSWCGPCINNGPAHEKFVLNKVII